MSNPVFEKSPYFGERAQRTPNGYPTYPGYTPGAGTTYATPSAAQQGYQPTGVEDLERAYRAPAAAPAETGRMTYDDVIVKTGVVLGVIVAFGLLNGSCSARTRC